MDKSKTNSRLTISKSNSKISLNKPNSKLETQNTITVPLVEIRPQLKIYIDGINTFVSQAIVEEVRNDHKAIDSDFIKEHKFFGTINESENAPPPNGVFKSYNHK